MRSGTGHITVSDCESLYDGQIRARPPPFFVRKDGEDYEILPRSRHRSPPIKGRFPQRYLIMKRLSFLVSTLKPVPMEKRFKER